MRYYINSIKLRVRLRVATIKKASCARLRVRRVFGLRSCGCGNSKQVASHALVNGFAEQLFFQLFIVLGMYNFGKGAKLTNQTAQGRKVNLWQRDQSQYVIQSIGLVSLTKQCAKVLNILFSINVISFGIFLLNWLWILLSKLQYKLQFKGASSISVHFM